MNRRRFLKIILRLAGVYYIFGAVVHFFGLTLSPFYDGKMYVAYHDTAIALVAIVLSILLFTIAHDPVKNIDSLNVIIVGSLIAILFSFWILWKVPTTELKHSQTIMEIILLTLFAGSLIWLKPKPEQL